MSEARGLFVRDATGLVREIGFTLGALIIICHTVGLGWQKRAFQFSAMPLPTEKMWLGLPPIFWAFLLGGLMILVIGFVAGLVTATMPRSGGGYVCISRIIHPFLGYIGGWMVFLAEGFSYGLIGTAVFEAIMLFYGIAGVPITMNADQLAIGGIIVVLIFGILGLLGVRLYGYILHVMFWIPAAITVLFFAMWIAGALNPSIVARGVEISMGVTPERVVEVAVELGMLKAAEETAFLPALSYAMLGAFWAYIGFYHVTYLAGEVKEANVKIPWIVLVASLIIVIIYIAASSLSAIAAMNAYREKFDIGEFTFFQAYSYLSYAADPEKVRAAIPEFKSAWSTGLASMIARGMGLDWVAWLIALAGVLWLANDIPPFLLVCSRVFFAMAFDRMLPEAFSYVSERWHSPVWAIVATMVAGVVGAVAEASESGLPGFVTTALAGKMKWAGVVGTDIYDAFFLIFFCLSCALLPFRRRDIYDLAAVKLPRGLWVFLGAVGTIFSCILMGMFWLRSGSSSWPS
ncbi:hypothetical protein B6U99_01185 [Candidatus Geothermarchaeota archaeon ex4572_27]|nr:MAG: hypothetical protein B6U99_01185 [Candidatus Geothermarchaeota archaeon ex4572_27]